jgi:hypothetical protein
MGQEADQKFDRSEYSVLCNAKTIFQQISLIPITIEYLSLLLIHTTFITTCMTISLFTHLIRRHGRVLAYLMVLLATFCLWAWGRDHEQDKLLYKARIQIMEESETFRICETAGRDSSICKYRMERDSEREK